MSIRPKAYRKQAQSRPCAQCGTVYAPWRPQSRFCSAACTMEYRRVNSHAWKVCVTCTKRFHADNPKRRFCSRVCANAALLRPVFCAQCGQPCKLPKHRYCSKACVNTMRKLRGDKVTRGRPLGATRMATDGYIAERVEGGFRLQHRVVMERKLGRALLPRETVHHLNGVRTDNRPENLELWAKAHPPGQRALQWVPLLVLEPALA